jgi:multiple sugar transport system ATP-binding protein
MAGLRLEHIYKVYPNGTKAVSDFTMDIKDKEFIVFVGPSGCGKSTTLRMIAGLEDISAGELYIGDRIVNDIEPKERDIAMVFQNYALYPHMTVYENMAFGLKLRHVPNDVIHEKVLWAADVLGLTEYLDRKPRAMSGGQRQRVALGRAILRNPKVMLLDEPLSNLDAKLRAQMRSEIAKLHDQLGTTFIYVTHDQVEAMTLGTRVVVMKLGKIMQIDTPKNLYDYPDNKFVAGFIGTPQMNFFEATLSKDKDVATINFISSKGAVKLPLATLNKVQPHYFDNKTIVWVGLRCEDVSVDPEIVKNSSTTIDVKVSHFEELGNETLIYGDINMEGDGFGETTTRIIIKGKNTYGIEKGQVVKAALNLNRVHMFDKQSEVSIMPRDPKENLVVSEVKDHLMHIGSLEVKLPSAIDVTSGSYDVLVPTSSILLNGGEYSAEVKKCEKMGDHFLLDLSVSGVLLFAHSDSEIKVGNKVKFGLDFTQFNFTSGAKVVKESIPVYDRLNAMFLNYATAKSYVGDKFNSTLEERLNNVKAKYSPILQGILEEYKAKETEYSTFNSAPIVIENKPVIMEAKANLIEEVAQLNAEFKENLLKLNEEHKDNNEKIINDVNTTYNKIRDEENKTFMDFKAINKDHDAYRKRAQDHHDFNSNFNLEKHNELDKRLNLEAIRFETEVNSLKGNLKRNKEAANKKYNDVVATCNDKAYPFKRIKKELNQKYKDTLKAFNEEKMHAGIIFFFKIKDLVTLSSDAISNKMIQGLGVKVFTKQYLVEIPHDGYTLSQEEGFEATVKQILDYDTHKYLLCECDDGEGIKNIYVEVKNIDGIQVDDKILVTYDINKCHITEKGMDIKIY